MPYDPDRHHRRTIRLRDYDYTQGGAYFVTICVYDRACVLSEIAGESIILSCVGEMIGETWDQLPERFSGIELDAHVIMPNHFHGVIVLPDKKAGAASSAPTLGAILRTFKSVSAIAGNRLLDQVGIPFWQRNYFEHIVRNEDDLRRIQQYIAENPARWAEDPENPLHHPAE